MGRVQDVIGPAGHPSSHLQYFQRERRTREIVFPANDPSVPTLYLEDM
jgi:hypothetical protein